MAEYIITEHPDYPYEEPKPQELIRCKDCKHWDTTWTNDYSPNYHYCPIADRSIRNDFYCADAEMTADIRDMMSTSAKNACICLIVAMMCGLIVLTGWQRGGRRK